MKYRLLVPLIAFVCIASASMANDRGYARPELLLEPDALVKPDVAEGCVILDARSREDYQKEHIPNARWVNHDTWAKAFDEGKDATGWGQRISDLGIGRKSMVVVYDNNAMKDAARIWWILRYWGVDDVRLLNGGWKTWKANEFPTTAEEPLPAKAVDFTPVPRVKRLATKSQILDLLKGKTLQIVDARSEDEFCGIDKLTNKRAGAIPGAMHLEWSELIDQETHRFKSAEELERLFRETGIDVKRPTASHCQSGGRASVMAFGLELMGAEAVRNYYRGWSEWGNAADTPIEPGKKAEKALR